MSKYRVGDIVVALSEIEFDDLIKIDRIGRDGSLWDNRWRMVRNSEMVRLATEEEIKVGRRL